MENHVTSINTTMSFQNDTWKIFEYKTIQYEDGTTVVRLKGYSDPTILYESDGYLEKNSELGKKLDLWT